MSDAFDWTAFLPEFSRSAEAEDFIPHTLLETADGAVMAWERPGYGEPVYLSAGIHGDEPAGPLAALALMDGGFFPKDRHCIVCPALNPSGLAAASRTNRLGVDLNRDYLHMSTPETAAHARWLESRPCPGLFVSLHEDWETEGFYFYEINLGEDDPDRADHLLKAVSPYFCAEPGPEIDGHATRAPGWIFHRAEADLPDAWPEAIWLAKRGCPLSFTFETPSAAPRSERVAAHVAGVRALFSRV